MVDPQIDANPGEQERNKGNMEQAKIAELSRC
jgi:hypothetical protein